MREKSKVNGRSRTTTSSQEISSISDAREARSFATYQAALDVFRTSFSGTFNDDLPVRIQTLKGHLFNRSFDLAFNDPSLSAVYAIRWSASRSLAYIDLFDQLRKHLPCEQISSSSEPSCSTEQPKTVICLGGSAAELTAVTFSRCFVGHSAISLALLDRSASLVTTLKELKSTCSDIMPAMSVEIAEGWDALAPGSIQQVNAIIGEASGSVLVCLMFTLNELYSSSMKMTTCFLKELTMSTPTGSWLLVVDSPGSYSGVNLQNSQAKGEEGVKRYPMQWLLRHTLLAVQEPQSRADWEEVVSDDSRWYRLPKGLDYPLKLENTRYQMHLYNRL